MNDLISVRDENTVLKTTMNTQNVQTKQSLLNTPTDHQTAH